MTPEEFSAYWTRHYWKCPPIGFLLKHVYREQCVRFANVGRSGQGPRNEDESAEALRRQNELIQYLYESEARIVLITTIPSEQEVPERDSPTFLNVDPEGQFVHSLGMHEFELEFETPSYWHQFISTQQLAPGKFDALLRTAAQDPAESGLRNLLFLGPATRRILYVHDGGMDVVMETPQKRDQLAERFQEWLLDESA